MTAAPALGSSPQSGSGVGAIPRTTTRAGIAFLWRSVTENRSAPATVSDCVIAAAGANHALGVCPGAVKRRCMQPRGSHASRSRAPKRAHSAPGFPSGVQRAASTLADTGSDAGIGQRSSPARCVHGSTTAARPSETGDCESAITRRAESPPAGTGSSLPP